MAKKKTKGAKVKVNRNTQRIGISGKSYREIKKQAVSLGMPFPDIVATDTNGLLSYINKHLGEKPSKELIVEYDLWMDKQLSDLGYKENDPMRHFQLRLGYVSDESNIEKQLNKVNAKPKVKKKKKETKPKELDKHGLWKGTRKSLTYDCAKKGYSLEKTNKVVFKEFPDAKEVSIKQWYKRALKDA